jgi:hypothetical protein
MRVLAEISDDAILPMKGLECYNLIFVICEMAFVENLEGELIALENGQICATK